MKTPKDLQDKIQSNTDWMNKDENKYSPKRKTLIRENKNLKEMKMYLETSPTEEFLKSEKSRLARIIKGKEDGYDYWLRNVCPDHVETKKRKALFSKENNLSELKRHLKNVKFLLD